jgi:hypothetical protein
MYSWRWFDPDDVDPEDAGYLTDEERAFAAALADATAPLVTPDLHELLIPAAIARDFHPENELVAGLGYRRSQGTAASVTGKAANLDAVTVR